VAASRGPGYAPFAMRHKFPTRLFFFAALGLALLTFAASCGDSPGSHDMSGMGHSPGGMTNTAAPAGSIRVDLLNWSVVPAQVSTKAGTVTFFAVHDMGHMHSASEGGVTHDLQVMRKGSDGSFELVGQVQGLTMGEAKALTLDLTAGNYELSCNVVEQVNGKTISHYANGMHTPFTVTA